MTRAVAAHERPKPFMFKPGGHRPQLQTKAITQNLIPFHEFPW